ncbi:hypothetical protein [Rarobacter incanus]|uniref:hypothetical protein n=1 Tax=Rarobacter incanus TaxID=153494 RepID=UPI00114FB0BC|nr:hypothetical protein [Rarobacter incanus]
MIPTLLVPAPVTPAIPVSPMIPTILVPAPVIPAIPVAAVVLLVRVVGVGVVGSYHLRETAGGKSVSRA